MDGRARETHDVLTAERATLSPLTSVVTVGLGLVMVAMLLGGPVPLQGRCRQGRLASQCAAAEHRRRVIMLPSLVMPRWSCKRRRAAI